MKRIIPILGILVVVALIATFFWFVNGARGFSFEHEVRTDLSMEKVYRVLTDKDLQQFFGTSRTNLTYETNGRVTLGTRMTYSVLDGDKVYPFTEEVVEMVKPNRYAVKMETEPFEATLTYEMERVGAETYIHVTADGNLKGWAKWGGSVARSAIEQKVRGDLDELALRLNRSVELRLLLDQED